MRRTTPLHIHVTPSLHAASGMGAGAVSVVGHGAALAPASASASPISAATTCDSMWSSEPPTPNHNAHPQPSPPPPPRLSPHVSLSTRMAETDAASRLLAHVQTRQSGESNGGASSEARTRTLTRPFSLARRAQQQAQQLQQQQDSSSSIPRCLVDLPLGMRDVFDELVHGRPHGMSVWEHQHLQRQQEQEQQAAAAAAAAASANEAANSENAVVAPAAAHADHAPPKPAPTVSSSSRRLRSRASAASVAPSDPAVLKRATVLALERAGAVTLYADHDTQRLAPAPKIVRELPSIERIRMQAAAAAAAIIDEAAAARAAERARTKAAAAEASKLAAAANRDAATQVRGSPRPSRSASRNMSRGGSPSPRAHSRILAPSLSRPASRGAAIALPRSPSSRHGSRAPSRAGSASPRRRTDRILSPVYAAEQTAPDTQLPLSADVAASSDAVPASTSPAAATAATATVVLPPLPVVPFAAQGNLDLYSLPNIERRLANKTEPAFVQRVRSLFAVLEGVQPPPKGTPTHAVQGEEKQQPEQQGQVDSVTLAFAPRSSYIHLLMLIYAYLHDDEGSGQTNGHGDGGASGAEGVAAAMQPSSAPAQQEPSASIRARLASLHAALSNDLASLSLAHGSSSSAATPPTASSPADARSQSQPQHVSFADFHSALFQLADVWTLGVSLHEYCSFLDTLHAKITRPMTDKEIKKRWRASLPRRSKRFSQPQSPLLLPARREFVWDDVSDDEATGGDGATPPEPLPDASATAPASKDDDDSDDHGVDRHLPLHDRLAAQADLNQKPSLADRMRLRASRLAHLDSLTSTPSSQLSRLPSSSTLLLDEKSSQMNSRRSTAVSSPLESGPTSPTAGMSRVRMAIEAAAAQEARRAARAASKLRRASYTGTDDGSVATDDFTSTRATSRRHSSITIGSQIDATSGSDSSLEDDDDANADAETRAAKRAPGGGVAWSRSSGRHSMLLSSRDSDADAEADRANRARLAQEAKRRREQLERLSTPGLFPRSGRRTASTHASPGHSPRLTGGAEPGEGLVLYDPLLLSTHIGVTPDGHVHGTMSPLRALVARPKSSPSATASASPAATARGQGIPNSARPSRGSTPGPWMPGAQAQATAPLAQPPSHPSAVRRLPSARLAPSGPFHAGPPPSASFTPRSGSQSARTHSARQQALDALRAQLLSEARAAECDRANAARIVVKVGHAQGLLSSTTPEQLAAAQAGRKVPGVGAPITHLRFSSIHAMVAHSLGSQTSRTARSAVPGPFVAAASRAPQRPPLPRAASSSADRHPLVRSVDSDQSALLPQQQDQQQRSLVFSVDPSDASSDETDPHAIASAAAPWSLARRARSHAIHSVAFGLSLDQPWQPSHSGAAHSRAPPHASCAEEKQEDGMAGHLWPVHSHTSMTRQSRPFPSDSGSHGRHTAGIPDASAPSSSGRPVSTAPVVSSLDLNGALHRRLEESVAIATARANTTTRLPTASGRQAARPGTAPLALPSSPSGTAPPPVAVPRGGVDGASLSTRASPSPSPTPLVAKAAWRPRPNSSLAMPARLRQLEHVLGRQPLATGGAGAGGGGGAPQRPGSAADPTAEFRRPAFDPATAASPLYVDARGWRRADPAVPSPHGQGYLAQAPTSAREADAGAHVDDSVVESDDHPSARDLSAGAELRVRVPAAMA